ncbi:HNH endonuclease [Neobacillus citreus]|uniref:HNH endonuclease n=1 Tax=Neobacillus citreus TaxID=2833578 RepID=A0A942T1E2_9BACI
MYLSKGENPKGYTWNNNEELGVLQLAVQEVHADNGHTGGR